MIMGNLLWKIKTYYLKHYTYGSYIAMLSCIEEPLPHLNVIKLSQALCRLAANACVFDNGIVTLAVSNASSSVLPLVRKISIALSLSCHQRLWTSFISSYVQEKEAGSVSPWGLWGKDTLWTTKTQIRLITYLSSGWCDQNLVSWYE